jgi:hypothetical protein
MSTWDKLSPHAQSLWRWIGGNDATKRKVEPPSLAQIIYPHLPSENRGAPVEQPKPNVGIAGTIYPHLRRR